MIDLSPTHVHLLLNHFPTVGFMIGIALFIAGLYVKSDHLKQASMVIIAGIALLTVPVFVTGTAAQMVIQDQEGVSVRLIEMHEELAFIGLILMQFAGGFAWLGLWHYRRMQRLPGWNSVALLVLAAATFLIVARAANIGGEIRHPEIRLTQEVTEMPIARQIAKYISETPPAWVICETLHFVGLTLIIGILLLVNIRTLGLVKSVPYSALERLLPWAILGYGVNVITGMLFFITMPGQYISSNPFYWKLVFLMVAGANTIYFLFDHGWDDLPGRTAPIRSQFVAASAMVLWVGVMFWGSMLPFLGDAF